MLACSSSGLCSLQPDSLLIHIQSTGFLASCVLALEAVTACTLCEPWDCSFTYLVSCPAATLCQLGVSMCWQTLNFCCIGVNSWSIAFVLIPLPTALTHCCTDNTQRLAETCSLLRIVLGQSNSYFSSSCWCTTPGVVLSLSL